MPDTNPADANTNLPDPASTVAGVTADPDTDPLWAPLTRQLDEDHDVTLALMQLLTDERQILAARDYTRFQQLLNRKRQLLLELEQGHQRRLQWLKSAGLASESVALETATRTAPEVAAQWRTLADLWQQCQELNRGNEQIAQRTRGVVGRMLDMLRSGNEGNALYDANGQASTPGQGQRLGDA